MNAPLVIIRIGDDLTYLQSFKVVDHDYVYTTGDQTSALKFPMVYGLAICTFLETLNVDAQLVEV
jgi:hypothetical protein